MKYKVFLINMKKSTDRYSFMSEQLKREGFDFITQEGIDGLTYNFDSLYDEDYAKNCGTLFIPMNSREKAISLSHRTVLERALEENLDYALVLEDDVEIPFDFKNIIELEIKKRDKNITKWEYLSFNYPTVGLHFVKLWSFLFLNMFKRNTSFVFYLKLPIYLAKFLFILLISLFEKIREIMYATSYKYGKPGLFYRPLYLAGCYLVSKEGAKKLIRLNEKLTYTADRLPNIARIKLNFKFYAFIPLLVKQRRDKFWDAVTEEDKKNFFNN